MCSIEIRFVIGPSDILFAGVYVCTFQPQNWTGWGSEGVSHSKCIYNESNTLSSLSSSLLILWQPNLVRSLSSRCRVKIWDGCVHGQGHGECLLILYFLCDHISLQPNQLCHCTVANKQFKRKQSGHIAADSNTLTCSITRHTVGWGILL